MRRWFGLVAVVLLTACGKDTEELTFAEWWLEGSELEFAITEAVPSVREELPVLPALTGEQKAGNWLLDTGARYSVIDRGLAEALRVEVQVLPERYAGEGAEFEEYVVVEALEVGGCLMRGAKMWVGDPEDNVDGVIGQDILRRTVLLMEPGADGGMAICKPGRAFSLRWREWKRWHPEESQTFELELEYREGVPFLNVEGEGPETPAGMLVDTGAVRSGIPQAWVSVEAKVAGEAVTLPEFAIGEWSIRNLEVGDEAVLGYPTLREFLIAIDGSAAVLRVVVPE